MSEDMNLSIMGQSKVPPGFRFHPTEEELLHYYLRKKVACQNIDLDVIRDVDLNKLEPWDIQEKCKIGSTPQDDWYFFSHKDKKYPTGTRTNRATAAGFWKATGRDKVIHNSLRRIGMRKTLVFYTGRAPHGQKSDWIMHEYRLDDDTNNNISNNSGLNISGEEEGWVVCRVFKKKNYLNKSLHHHVSPSNSTSILRQKELIQRHQHMLTAYMGQSSPASAYKQDQIVGFSHLPRLESPNMNPSSTVVETCNFKTSVGQPARRDWVELERLVASQLGCQPSKQLYFSSYGDRDSSFPLDHDDEVSYMEQAGGKNNNSQATAKVSSSETGFWSFGHESSSLSSLCSDPLCHLSV